MKKQIIAGIGIIACVALCAAVWPRSVEVEGLPAEPIKATVSAEIEARSAETSHSIISKDVTAPEVEPVAENEPQITEITAEEKTETAPPTAQTSSTISKPAPVSSEPKPGTIAVIDGVKSMWVPGFGWVKDEGGGSVAIPVDGEGDIDKQIGVMDGGTMVGNPGDELTGHKVGIMDGGTVAEDMYENGHKIGSMGDGESPPKQTIPQSTEQPETSGDEIHIVFVEVPEKDTTPPPYKPDTTSP